MSLRDRLNGIAERVRGIPASSALDERPTSVTIRTTVFDGGRVGAEGTTHVTDLVIAPTPKVREITQKEITASGGRYVAGDVKVGPITPANSGGGYTYDQLVPPVANNGIRVVYVLVGNQAGDYDRVGLESARSHSWFLVLRVRRSTPR